jgi:hypothetical protein
MDVDSLLPILRSADNDPVTGKEPSLLYHLDGMGSHHHGAIHSALLRQNPITPDLEVLGIDGRGMEVRRRHAMLRNRFHSHIGGGSKWFEGEVGRRI